MIAFMFADTLGYALLAWYFEQVLPNEYGSHRPPWFVFTRKYWCARNEQAEQPQQPASPLIEPGQLNSDHDHDRGEHEHGHADDHHMGSVASHIEPVRSAELLSKARLVISHLYKVFSHGNGLWNRLTCRPPSPSTRVVAVRDLSLTMYEGQITCLLGHNGFASTNTTNTHAQRKR